MKTTLIIPAIYKGFRSRSDKTVTLSFETNELTPEQGSIITTSINDFGYLAFKNEPFTTDDRELLEQLKTDSIEDGSKTPSQQFRGVLFRNWEQKNEGYKLFADYYRAKYEIIITHFKGKLE